jgi:hypothetical protein
VAEPRGEEFAYHALVRLALIRTSGENRLNLRLRGPADRPDAWGKLMNATAKPARYPCSGRIGGGQSTHQIAHPTATQQPTVSRPKPISRTASRIICVCPACATVVTSSEEFVGDARLRHPPDATARILFVISLTYH